MVNKSAERHPLPFVLLVILLPLWWLISLVMLLSAIIGLICLVLGAFAVFVDYSQYLDLKLAGASVQTTTHKLQFLGVSAAMVITGVGFWWLRRRGHIVGPLIFYLLLLVLFLTIFWFTNSANIIAVDLPNQ